MLLFLGSCVTDEANRYFASEQYPATNPSSVEVLTSRPAKPFKVIAEFQSRGESDRSYKRKAAAIGADAIIVKNLGGYASLHSDWAGEDPYADSHSRRVAIAIKYE